MHGLGHRLLRLDYLAPLRPTSSKPTRTSADRESDPAAHHVVAERLRLRDSKGEDGM
jgi:hypothetical protein